MYFHHQVLDSIEVATESAINTLTDQCEEITLREVNKYWKRDASGNTDDVSLKHWCHWHFCIIASETSITTSVTEKLTTIKQRHLCLIDTSVLLTPGLIVITLSLWHHGLVKPQCCIDTPVSRLPRLTFVKYAFVSLTPLSRISISLPLLYRNSARLFPLFNQTNNTHHISGELQPPQEIENSVCPNECSGHGKCLNATCSCDQGYISTDCSIKEGEWVQEVGQRKFPCNLSRLTLCFYNCIHFLSIPRGQISGSSQHKCSF